MEMGGKDFLPWASVADRIAGFLFKLLEIVLTVSLTFNIISFVYWFGLTGDMPLPQLFKKGFNSVG